MIATKLGDAKEYKKADPKATHAAMVNSAADYSAAYSKLTEKQRSLLRISYEAYLKMVEEEDQKYIRNEKNWKLINKKHAKNITDYAANWFQETDAILCCYVIYPNDADHPYRVQKLGPTKVIEMMPDLDITEVTTAYEKIKNESKKQREALIFGRSTSDGDIPVFEELTKEVILSMTALDISKAISDRLNTLYGILY